MFFVLLPPLLVNAAKARSALRFFFFFSALLRRERVRHEAHGYNQSRLRERLLRVMILRIRAPMFDAP